MDRARRPGECGPRRMCGRARRLRVAPFSPQRLALTTGIVAALSAPRAAAYNSSDHGTPIPDLPAGPGAHATPCRRLASAGPAATSLPLDGVRGRLHAVGGCGRGARPACPVARLASQPVAARAADIGLQL